MVFPETPVVTTVVFLIQLNYLLFSGHMFQGFSPLLSAPALCSALSTPCTPQRPLLAPEGRLTLPHASPSKAVEEQQKALHRRHPAPPQIPPGFSRGSAAPQLSAQLLRSPCGSELPSLSHPLQPISRTSHPTRSGAEGTTTCAQHTTHQSKEQVSQEELKFAASTCGNSPAICACGYLAIPTDNFWIIIPLPAQATTSRNLPLPRKLQDK